MLVVGVGGRRREIVRGMCLLAAVGGGGRFERGGEEEEKKEVQIVGIKLGGQCQWMTEISTPQFYQLLILRTENA